jgi:hypothetical protein
MAAASDEAVGLAAAPPEPLLVVAEAVAAVVAEAAAAVVPAPTAAGPSLADRSPASEHRGSQLLTRPNLRSAVTAPTAVARSSRRPALANWPRPRQPLAESRVLWPPAPSTFRPSLPAWRRLPGRRPRRRVRPGPSSVVWPRSVASPRSRGARRPSWRPRSVDRSAPGSAYLHRPPEHCRGGDLAVT